ncbi:hypothetical protein [Roseimaritima ulvae]|uniref:CHAT domain protein n=1 Tax=Roseimaritima ulvae TaxID=980254 RepID=A0A5B9R2V2_9BACT|nr:hypothetical protein [Roseimaritima ulvae]QEG40643.1 CHAT domain protein [Roseimaritima ulvae]
MNPSSSPVVGKTLLLAFAVILMASGRTFAQPALQLPQQTYPSQTYYQALEVYRTGELSLAIKAFEDALSRCRRNSQGRWIDAIPVHAMLAECHYEAGNLRLAHQHLDQALQIASRFPNWIMSLQWPSVQNPNVSQAVNRAPWWTGTPIRVAYVPKKIPLNMTSTNIGTGPDGQLGASTVTTAQAIDAIEILRGMGIVYYRRQVILGPLAVSEPLLERSIKSLGNAPGNAGPLGAATISSIHTLAGLANGGGPRRASSGSANSTISGNYVHPLTPVLLCGAARVLAGSDKPEAAYPLALQAAAAASMLEQPEWASEAFEIAVGVKPDRAAGEVYQASASAMQVFARDSRLATARLGIVAAEAAMDAGRPGEAEQAFQAAGGLLDRRDVELPRRLAYFQYINARRNAARGDLTASDLAIKQLVGFTARRAGLESTPRLYQLRLIESASRASKLGGKTSEALLEEYLRAPRRVIWMNDPVDALGFIASDHSATMAGWIRAAASRNAGEDVLVRGDIQAVRNFTAQLPLAGRVLQARWLATAPDAALGPDAIAFRKKPPAALARLRQLTQQPVPDDPAAARVQADAAESAAYTVALQRADLPVAFPRPLTAKSDFERLADNEAVLAFVPAGNNLLGVLATNKKTTVWPVNGYRTLPAQIGRLMQEIGVARKRGSAAQLPADDSAWRSAATQIRDRVIPKLDAFKDIQRLAIVPTAGLWYLPFEILPVGDADSPLLGDRTQILYAPTPGLAVYSTPTSDRPVDVGILTQLFFAPRDGERNEELSEAIRGTIDNPVALPGAGAVPGRWLGAQCRHIVVAAAVTPSPTTKPFAWSPLGYDAGMPGGLLDDWMRLPMAPPQSVALPGLRTGASQASSNNGDEVFYAAMSMHAAGVSQLILARWPVGGESTAGLLKEYVQELPFSGVEDSWRRALAVLRETELDPEAEPLLSDEDAKRQSLTGNPPLFWSGYMLFDGLSKTPK